MNKWTLLAVISFSLITVPAYAGKKVKKEKSDVKVMVGGLNFTHITGDVRPAPKPVLPPQDVVIQVGSITVTNACGTTFDYKGGNLRNASPVDIAREQERSDMALNKIIGAQSWGCHVRPEPTVVVQPQAAPYCYGYRPTLPYCYGTRTAPSCYGTPRTMVYAPPGVATPGCSCAGHAPGEPCHCGPGCTRCGGNRYLGR